MVLVAGAGEVRQRKSASSRNKRKTGRYAGRVRLAVVPDRSARSPGGFIKRNVAPGATLMTDDWSGYAKLGACGYCHTAVAERGDMQVAETFLPIIHLVFSHLKTWLRGIHHGVSPQHLQAYLNDSASIAASTRSTPSVPCSASPVTSPRRPMPSFMPKNHNPLHLVGVGANRISTG